MPSSPGNASAGKQPMMELPPAGTAPTDIIPSWRRRVCCCWRLVTRRPIGLAPRPPSHPGRAQLPSVGFAKGSSRLRLLARQPRPQQPGGSSLLFTLPARNEDSNLPLRLRLTSGPPRCQRGAGWGGDVAATCQSGAPSIAKKEPGSKWAVKPGSALTALIPWPASDQQHTLPRASMPWPVPFAAAREHAAKRAMLALCTQMQFFGSRRTASLLKLHHLHYWCWVPHVIHSSEPFVLGRPGGALSLAPKHSPQTLRVASPYAGATCNTRPAAV